MTTHPYDGTMNDGFCACGQPRHDPVHADWREAWHRSRRIQRRLQDEAARETQRGMQILAANTTTQERARQEYESCHGRGV